MTTPTLAPGRPRIIALDILRGAVMVLMAIDHVRVYSGVPAGGPTAGIFLTRWVTHFCAPAFVFFAGTAAFLHGRKLASRRELARFLLTRGLLLVLLELTVIRAAWTFGADYSEFILAGVIWMLGWCMVLLAGFLWLPVWAIGAVGLILILGQDLVGVLAGALPDALAWAGQFLYLGGEIRLGAEGPGVAILYTIVPWIGVMAAGYAFGAIVTREGTDRRRLCLRIGFAAIALFVVGAGLPLLMWATPDDGPLWIQFLNQRKYPASLLFLLMTLGPVIALIPPAERMRGWVADALAVFGRVPMFYYLLHIPLIHLTALVVTVLREDRIDPARYATAPFVSLPEEFRWGLPLLYLVFVIVVALLYAPCRWFAQVKARRRDSWLSYL